MGVGLPTKDDYSSKAVCDASSRAFAGKQVHSCESLPAEAAQCDNFYVCDATGENCNACQIYKFTSYKNMGRASGRMCRQAPGGCESGVEPESHLADSSFPLL